MNRRDLIKAVILGGAGTSIKTAAAEPRKIGRLTVEGHRAHQRITGENLHVFLDGVEVKNVFEADDIEGYALVFCTDQAEHKDWTARGARHLAADRHAACTLRVTGNIEFRVLPEPNERT